MADLLAADTTMGAVTLRVADLDDITRYYRDAVLLEVLEQSPGRTVLGRRRVPVVVLESSPPSFGMPRRARPASSNTAIPFETQADLAAAVFSVASRHPGTFTSSADHLVSKTFYFADPEGNGVELYTDGRPEPVELGARPGRDGDDHLDPNTYLRQHLDQPSVDAAPADRLWSATCTSAWATSAPHTASTSTSSASRPRPPPGAAGALRERRWLPPPNGHEHLDVGRGQPATRDRRPRAGPD